MRYSKILCLITALIVVLTASVKDKRITIFTVGDSTMANKKIDNDKQERGWGMMLKGFFSDDVRVENHAVNGRSSKSFIDEGRWQAVVNRIKPGDYVFIQFGHNDEKPDPKRHTVSGGSFDDNLRRFVNEARAKGGIPVLFNSVVRRNFSGSTTAVADDDIRGNSSMHLQEGDKLIDTHGDYIVAPRRVAKELNVPFVDANAITHRLEQGLGVEGSKKLHMIFAPGETPSLPEGRSDNTHYNINGATIVAGLLADEVGKQVKELRKYIRHYDIVVAKDGSGRYFDLQKAIDAAPAGKQTTILVDTGAWPKPVIPNDKRIKITYRK